MPEKRFVRAVASAALGLFATATGCSNPKIQRDVQYDDRFGASTQMDVYEPDGAGPHPGILLIHGGSWSGGNRGEYTQAADRFARSGYVAATIEYRLVGGDPDGQFPKNIQDCICALSYFRAHAADFGLDPARVAVMGYSAGGHLASLVGVGADAPELAPDCAAGPTGKPQAVISGAGWDDFRGHDNGVFAAMIGGTEDAVPALWADASPITHVTSGEPPFLFVNGDSDWFAPPSQGRAMHDALVAAGDQADLLDVSGGGHLLQASDDIGHLTGEESDLTDESWIAIIDFLQRTIGR